MDHWWLVPAMLTAIIIVTPLSLAAVRAARWATQTLMLAVIILLALYLVKGLAGRTGSVTRQDVLFTSWSCDGL